MTKKLNTIKQGQSSNLSLKPAKSRQQKKMDKIKALKVTLKNLLVSKKAEINDKIYNDEKYSYYFTTIFNSKIIYMLIIFINKNKDKLKEYNYDKEPNFINKFIHLIKELCLNEIEVAYFTLLLDKIGWAYSNFNHWLYFYSLGSYTKKIVTSEFESDELLKLKQEASEKYSTLVNEPFFEEFESKGISTQEINQRFKELTKPINSFCRKTFINYSSIADKIMRLSQPYGEESNGNQLFIEKNIDEINNINIMEKNKFFDDFYENNVQMNKTSIINQISNINGGNKLTPFNAGSIFGANIYNQVNLRNNFTPNLGLSNIGNSQLSLINQRSDHSITLGIQSSINNM
jgi:hypothetical protein